MLRVTSAKGVHVKECGGAEASTTNNRMELTGAIEGLRALKRPCKVKLYCDSQYVIKGIREWLAGWKQKGWQKPDKKPVMNVELWQELDELLHIHSVEAIWLKGHAGHPENERVDALARSQAESLAASGVL